MAGGKQRELTAEEQLERALAPEEEWPYEVPGNWVWTRTGRVIKVIMGQSPSGEDTTDDASFTGLIGGAADMGELYPKVSRYTVKPTKLSKKNDIIVSIRATLGRPIYSDGEYCLGRGVSALRSDIITSSFIRYFILNFEEYLYSVATGTTFAQVSKNDLENMPFPLPPLAEQQRIVDRIESLFAKLDQAKELAQNALDTFETRNAAILHKAFTGELTAKWREKHGVSMDSWERNPLRNYVLTLTQGWSPKCEPFPSKSIEEWGVIKTTAIQHLEFDEFENKQLPEHLKPRVQHEIKGGDILITRAGPRVRVGVCCLVKDVRPHLLLCDKAYRFNALSDKTLSEFLVLQLNTTSILDKINQMKTGISDSGVNLTQDGFLSIEIVMPTLPEQQEIVRILDSLFEKEQKAKELCDVIDKIDLMKKAILARAFRGELGTNDPGEESALSILQLASSLKGGTKAV